MRRTIFFLVSLVLWSCKPIHAAEKQPETEIAPATLELIGKAGGYPLTPGLRWTYRVEDSDVEMHVESTLGPVLDGIQTTKLRAIFGEFLNDTDLFVGTATGDFIQMGRFGYEERLARAAPSLTLFKSSPRQGLSWKVNSRWDDDSDESKWRVQIGELAPIQTPAGRFNAWRIDYEIVDPMPFQQDFRGWFAPGVGFVRLDELYRRRPDDPPAMPLERHWLLARIEETAKAHPVEYPTRSEPISRLPARVPAPADGFSLYADFQDVWLGKFVLYVINNTDQKREIDAQDWDYYIKQEFLNDKGEWERSQPHEYSSCGNSYVSAQIPARSFVSVLGWQPKKGREAKVRYRFYSDAAVASNEGVGRVNDREIVWARFDEMALPTAKIEIIKSVLFEFPWGDWDEIEKEDPAWPERYFMLRESAYKRLAELPADQSVPLLLRCWQARPLEQPELVMDGLRRALPAQWVELVKDELKSDDPERRAFVIEHAGYWTGLDDLELRGILIGMIGNDRFVDDRRVIEALAQMPKGSDGLQRMIESGTMAAESRDCALFALARTNKTPGIALSANALPIAEYDRFAVEVTIENKGGEDLRFEYSKPTDILAVRVDVDELNADKAVDSRSLSPKAGVRWLTQDAARVTNAITLAPGDKHIVHIELTDYFQFPNCRGKAYIACQLPGKPDYPQIVEGDLPFSILSIDSRQAQPKKDIFEKAMELEKQGR